VRNFFVGGVVHTELVDLSTDSPLKSSVIYEFYYYLTEKQTIIIRSSCEQKENGFSTPKTTFTQYDYYFISFSASTNFIQTL